MLKKHLYSHRFVAVNFSVSANISELEQFNFAKISVSFTENL